MFKLRLSFLPPNSAAARPAYYSQIHLWNQVLYGSTSFQGRFPTEVPWQKALNIVFFWLSEIVHHRAMMHVSWLVRVLLAPVLAGSSILGWPFCFTTDNFFALGFFCLYSYSWPLTWALRCSAIQVPIQPSSSRLFSLPLVSGGFRIQAGNSMNQSELITNTCSPFRQSAGNHARKSHDWFKSHL